MTYCANTQCLKFYLIYCQEPLLSGFFFCRTLYTIWRKDVFCWISADITYLKRQTLLAYCQSSINIIHNTHTHTFVMHVLANLTEHLHKIVVDTCLRVSNKSSVQEKTTSWPWHSSVFPCQPDATQAANTLTFHISSRTSHTQCNSNFFPPTIYFNINIDAASKNTSKIFSWCKKHGLKK